MRSTDGPRTRSAVTAARGLLRTFKAMERTPRLHVHAGRLGRGVEGRGSVEGAEEGCQETAIWEQGQERTSWQQLRGAKQKPLDWTREERKCWRK